MPPDTPPPEELEIPESGTTPAERQMRIYKAPRRRRRRPSVKRIILITVAVVLLLLLALAGAVAWWANGVYGQISNVSPGLKQAQVALDTTPPLPNRPAVALVIGVDHRGTDPKGDPGLSDTLMLVRMDPRSRYISLLSIPRDLQVDIPGVGLSKINAAYTYGGPKLAVQMVKKLTGVHINYLVTVDFQGFRDLVNAFGGVYINVDQFYFHSNAYTPDDPYSEIDIKPGYQLLRGPDALAFSRFRHTDSDFYRNARQQLFLQAFEARVSNKLSGISLTDLPTIKNVVETVANNVQVTGAHGAPGVRTVINYARLAYAIKGHVLSARLAAQVAGDTSNSYVTATPSAVSHAVWQFQHPQRIANPTGALPKPAKKQHHHRKHGFKPAVDPTTVTVAALNGNGVAGSGDKLGQALAPFGYQISVGNADSWSYQQTQVYYRPGYRKAAADLVRILGIGAQAPLPASYTQAADVVVVAGSDFKGTTAIKPPSTQQATAPVSTVHADDQAYLPVFRQASQRVDFHALYPTVVQNSSVFQSYTSEQPVRTYRIEAGGGDGANSLYAIYHLGDIAGAYWGIEETRFTDAPILDHPDAVRHLDGRTYDFWFNGGHIHLISFVQNGVATWVTNTLLNELANKDMIAIARSLRPVP